VKTDEYLRSRDSFRIAHAYATLHQFSHSGKRRIMISKTPATEPRDFLGAQREQDGK
jgi:hypothetical protein